MLRNILRKYLPFIGEFKRSIVAFKDKHLPKRSTYSQYKEDVLIYEIIKSYNFSKENNLYIDIGAFHPTQISNTYLLYRNDYRGVLIEPNYQLFKILEKYRQGDILINAGAGADNCTMELSIADSPDRSSLIKQNDIRYKKSIRIPVLRLDDIMKTINYNSIIFLSIDVEGFNLDVLKGAKETLAKTFLLCIEFDNEYDRIRYENVIGDKFELVKSIKCNLIYRNKTITVKQ